MVIFNQGQEVNILTWELLSVTSYQLNLLEKERGNVFESSHVWIIVCLWSGLHWSLRRSFSFGFGVYCFLFVCIWINQAKGFSNDLLHVKESKFVCAKFFNYFFGLGFFTREGFALDANFYRVESREAWLESLLISNGCVWSFKYIIHCRAIKFIDILTKFFIWRDVKFVEKL